MERVFTETTEDLLKRFPTWEYERTDRNGTRYFKNYQCGRCGGKGYYAIGVHNNKPLLSPHDRGVCWECGGTGRTTKPTNEKVYTPEHFAKLEANRNARKAAKEELKEKEFKLKLPELLQSPMHNFGIEGEEFVVYRVLGETFSIKEELKELGCKFKPSIGWYASHKLEGYDTQRLTSDQIISIDYKKGFITWLDKSEIEDLLITKKEPITSKFVGTVGEMITVTLKVDRVLAFESRYTWNEVNYLYIMSDKNGNQFKWSTQKVLEENETYTIRGKIKAHEIYNEIPQTVLTRCSIQSADSSN